MATNPKTLEELREDLASGKSILIDADASLRALINICKNAKRLAIDGDTIVWLNETMMDLETAERVRKAV